MAATPAKIALAGEQELEIQWTDGQTRRYRLQEFLDHCPCAGCREKRAAAPADSASSNPAPRDPLQVISATETQPLKLLSMQPVGSYAYSIHLSHGCQQGIFTFDALRQLGREI